MPTQRLKYDITKDDLSAFKDKGPAFVTFGEVMVRDTPNDANGWKGPARFVYRWLAANTHWL